MTNTVPVLDSFYGFRAAVPVSEYDVVYSFFKKTMTDRVAAETFTSALFQIAFEFDTPAMTLLEELRGRDQIEITVSMAVYLNRFRSPAALLGVGAIPAPNYYAGRNVQP